MTDATTVILDYFETLNAIPRCSHNEAEVCQWLCKWAAEHNLDYTRDQAGNLVVRVPASSGCQSAPMVVLQGHMDMVCEKTPDSAHDFSKDPIVSHSEGEWLTATDTTLGADNGIAIAYMLALVDDPSIIHPPMELLFTVDEETGLNGAKMLKPGFIEGQYLINLDSEDEGIFTIGCAGGVDTTMEKSFDVKDLPPDSAIIRVLVGGLKGGHSGIDIHKHRGNANKILARTLAQIRLIAPIQLISLDGGTLKNAIPRDAHALIQIDPDKESEVMDVVAQMAKTAQAEYAHSDKALFIKANRVAPSEAPSKAVDPEATGQIISMLLSLPDGVFHMSAELKGVVDTSSNLATVSLNHGKLVLLSSQRSASISRLDEISATVHGVTHLAGATAADHDFYPPWQPHMASLLLKRSKKTYQSLYDREPVVQVIHAGLECAVIGDIFPGMDMISFGPTIRNPHSPDERILIPTIIQVWDFLKALLKEMANGAQPSAAP
jgi:dipeptidase D